MKKYFQRGKFENNIKLAPVKFCWESRFNALAAVALQYRLYNRNSFIKILIMRGIGYRSFAIANDLHSINALNYNFLMQQRQIYASDEPSTPVSEFSKIVSFDLQNRNYLMLRAGHTNDLCLPLNSAARAVNSKKNRKLVVISNVHSISSNMAKQLWTYRRPSVYTGRGVRLKHIKPIKKAGKKDKQKGKAF